MVVRPFADDIRCLDEARRMVKEHFEEERAKWRGEVMERDLNHQFPPIRFNSPYFDPHPVFRP